MMLQGQGVQTEQDHMAHPHRGADTVVVGERGEQH